MQRAKQISESIELGIILALAGGFMDVYSYIGRDHVFANAQIHSLETNGGRGADSRIDTPIRRLVYSTSLFSPITV